MNGKTPKYVLELASLKISGKFPRNSFISIKATFCKTTTLLE